MFASALQVIGILVLAIAFGLWQPLVGLGVAGVGAFAIGLMLELR